MLERVRRWAKNLLAKIPKPRRKAAGSGVLHVVDMTRVAIEPEVLPALSAPRSMHDDVGSSAAADAAGTQTPPSGASAKAQAKADATKTTAEARATVLVINARAKARVRWMKEFRRWLREVRTALREFVQARAAAYRVRKEARQDFVRTRSERREQFWARMIREWAEFWERFSAARAAKYERKKAAKAAYLRDKQEAKSKWWAEFRKTIVTIFRTIRLEFLRTIQWMQRILRRNPHLLRDFAAKITSSTALLLFLVFLILVGMVFHWPTLWKLALIVLIVSQLYRFRREFRIGRIRARMRRLRRSPQRRKSGAKISWSFSFLLALVFIALTLYGIIIGSQWIMAFAPVGAVWSATLPILTRKSFWARCLKPAIIVPPSIWMAVWLVVRFK